MRLRLPITRNAYRHIVVPEVTPRMLEHDMNPLNWCPLPVAGDLIGRRRRLENLMWREREADSTGL